MNVYTKKFNKNLIVILAIVFTLGMGGVIAVRAVGEYAVPVTLGTAGNFGVLAGAGITDSVASHIIGNAGSFPTTSNGLPDIEVIGTNYIGGETVSAAKDALSTAYTDVSTRTLPSVTTVTASETDSFAYDGDYTLSPGIYKSGTSMGVPMSLTLDGGGNPNAVFIFQTGTSLNTVTGTEGSGSTITLTGGAQACNVFWAVGSAATFGTYSHFVGTVMANSEAITDAGGSIINGRLLAKTAAVTLNNTHVTVPTCVPSLLLQKEVDGGGPDANTAWTLTATRAGGTTNLSGITGTTGANSDLLFPAATFTAGTYTLAESGVTMTNYTPTYSCSNVNTNVNNGVPIITTSSSITLVAGDVATCTIKNTYTAPTTATLTLVKTRTNDNGGTAAATDWTLRAVGPTTTIFGATASVAVTNAVVNTGTYALSEDSGGPAGYVASTYSCVKNGAGAVVSNSINLIAGDTATCTINNNDIAAHLIIIKHVINDSGGLLLNAGNFTTTITGVTTATPTTGGVESPGIDNILTSVGAYSVDEGAHVGYTKTRSTDCSGTIALGDTKTCMITNNDIAPSQAILNVIKHVINNNGGSANASNFTMNVTGINVSDSSFTGLEDPGTEITLDAGTYSVDESAYAGYAKTLSADCSGNIIAGETNTCTITNDDIPQPSNGVSSGSGIVYGCKDLAATNYNFFSSSNPLLCKYATVASVVVSTPVVTPKVIIPNLPKTGFPPQEPWYIVILFDFFNLIKAY